MDAAQHLHTKHLVIRAWFRSFPLINQFVQRLSDAHLSAIKKQSTRATPHRTMHLLDSPHQKEERPTHQEEEQLGGAQCVVRSLRLPLSYFWTTLWSELHSTY